jgi:hypothetical protein
VFLSEFLDHKDSGTAILSHFYLLTGCAISLWLEGSSRILEYTGVLSLGVGDAMVKSGECYFATDEPNDTFPGFYHRKAYWPAEMERSEREDHRRQRGVRH